MDFTAQRSCRGMPSLFASLIASSLTTGRCFRRAFDIGFLALVTMLIVPVRRYRCPTLIILYDPALHKTAPERSDILNVGGFSYAVFGVVAAFLGDDAGRPWCLLVPGAFLLQKSA